jgi:hypothetical protein
MKQFRLIIEIMKEDTDKYQAFLKVETW